MAPIEYSEEFAIDITVYRSKVDGAVVVQIDTDPFDFAGEKLRVFINDGAIFDGDVEQEGS